MLLSIHYSIVDTWLWSHYEYMSNGLDTAPIVLRDHGDEEVPYDIFLNANRTGELRNEIESINRRLEGETENEFWQSGINGAEANRIILAILWMSVFQCNEFIVSPVKASLVIRRVQFLLLLGCAFLQRDCKWKGVDVPCQELFTLIPTDYGFCCSFHHDALDKMLRNSSYVAKVMDLDERYGRPPTCP